MKNKPIKVLEKNVDPKVIAKQYLFHEFVKLFGEPKDKIFTQKIHKWIYDFDKKFDDTHFWSLLAAISENLKLKWTHRILTDSSYKWNLEIWNISDIKMTGMGPEIDGIVRKCDDDFEKFRQYWNKNIKGTAFEKKLKKQGLHSKGALDDFPVLVHFKEGHYSVFDGMRRALLAALAGKKEIKVYVGYRIRQGQPQVNRWQMYFLTILLGEAVKSGDEKLAWAIGETLRGIFRNYRDSRKSYRDRIYKWVSPKSQEQIDKYVLRKR